jgi:hypothetical protein
MVTKVKNWPTLAEAQHQLIAAFSARLPLRPDTEQARFVLANASRSIIATSGRSAIRAQRRNGSPPT